MPTFWVGVHRVGLFISLFRKYPTRGRFLRCFIIPLRHDAMYFFREQSTTTTRPGRTTCCFHRVTVLRRVYQKHWLPFLADSKKLSLAQKHHYHVEMLSAVTLVREQRNPTTQPGAVLETAIHPVIPYECELVLRPRQYFFAGYGEELV